MEKTKEKLKRISRQLANAMIKQDAEEWPPKCGFIVYQPIRPLIRDETISQNEDD